MTKQNREKIERRLRYCAVLVKYSEGFQPLRPEQKTVRKIRHMDTRSAEPLEWWIAVSERWWLRMGIRAESYLFFFRGGTSQLEDAVGFHSVADWMELLPEGWADDAITSEHQESWAGRADLLLTALLECCVWSTTKAGIRAWSDLYIEALKYEELPEWEEM